MPARRRHRLHTVRFEAPLRDGDFVAVFGARAGKPSVREQELRHMATAGPCSAVEGLDESAREGSKPAPASPKHPASAIDNRIDRLFAGKEAFG